MFGSMARGDARADSDLDLLVGLDPDRTLMDLGGLLMDLRDALKTEVDVAATRMLRPGVRDRAMLDAVPQ